MLQMLPLTRITPAYAGTTKTVIKPVPADNVNYVNRSFTTNLDKNISKLKRESKKVDLASGGAHRPSSPIGDGMRLFPSSEAINTDIIPSHQAKSNAPGVKINPLNKQINKSAAADINSLTEALVEPTLKYGGEKGDHPRLRGNNKKLVQ